MAKNDEVFDDEELEGGDDEVEIVDDADDAEGDDADDESEPVVVPVIVADDLDEDDGPDTDVELALDEVLAERTRVTTDDEDEEPTLGDPDDKGDPNEVVLPQQADEFRCQSCFLLKKNTQLADKNKMFCRDCI